MNYNGEHYFEKITLIQQSMYKREKRRLELERELFAYGRSDKRISQMKCSKLRSFLKDISHGEERAKRRNLDLLREVEKLETSMKKFQPKPDTLLQLKVKVMDCQSVMDPVNKLVPSVMGRQTQVTPSSVSWDHIVPCSPEGSLHFPKHLQSGLLKDSGAGREDVVSNQAYSSDLISSLNDPPDAHNLSDKHERTTAELSNVCALTVSVSSERNEHKPSPPVTLATADERPSPCSSGPTGDEKSIGGKAHTSHSPGMENAEGGFKNSTPKRVTEGLPSSEESLSESKSSALSLSLTQSELDEDSLGSEAADEDDVMGDDDDHCQYSPKSSVCDERLDSAIEGVESLFPKGFFNLLDAIEEKLHVEQTKVYSDSSIDAQELNRIIRLCNRGEDLNGEEPGACGAVVLHELQRLSASTEKGCLLPPDVVSAHHSCTTTNEIRDCLLPGAAQLWDRWFKHALLLKERHVLTTEHLVQLFTPLLLQRNATYGHQAKVLLRTLLSRSSEEDPSAEDQSDGSSSGPLPDSRVQRLLQKQPSPELQSGEEDSQDESPVESVPIRESKAYQLLKQSAMQKRTVTSKEEENEEFNDLSGINDPEEDFGWAKRSSHQDPYPGTEGANAKAHSALQSKALWGESDDSDSEIEAALRPPPFNANDGDTDDFYD